MSNRGLFLWKDEAYDSWARMKLVVGQRVALGK